MKMKQVPMKRFKFSLEVELDEDQIWPNGDGPDYPDVDDVYAVVNKYHGIIKDWHLDQDLEITEVSLKKTKKR